MCVCELPDLWMGGRRPTCATVGGVCAHTICIHKHFSARGGEWAYSAAPMRFSCVRAARVSVYTMYVSCFLCTRVVFSRVAFDATHTHTHIVVSRTEGVKVLPGLDMNDKRARGMCAKSSSREFRTLSGFACCVRTEAHVCAYLRKYDQPIWPLK